MKRKESDSESGRKNERESERKCEIRVKVMENESDSLPMTLLDTSPSLLFSNRLLPALLSLIISVPSSTSVWVRRNDQRMIRS